MSRESSRLLAGKIDQEIGVEGPLPAAPPEAPLLAPSLASNAKQHAELETTSCEEERQDLQPSPPWHDAAHHQPWEQERALPKFLASRLHQGRYLGGGPYGPATDGFTADLQAPEVPEDSNIPAQRAAGSQKPPQFVITQAALTH